MKKQQLQLQPYERLTRTVGDLTPVAPRNGYDVAGFVLLGAAGIAFVFGAAKAGAFR